MLFIALVMDCLIGLLLIALLVFKLMAFWHLYADFVQLASFVIFVQVACFLFSAYLKEHVPFVRLYVYVCIF
jgi:hypothetical protein